MYFLYTSSPDTLYLKKTVGNNAILLYSVKSYIYIFSFSMTQQSLVGQSVLIIEASRSHSVGLLWTSDQPDAHTSTWRNTALTKDRYPCLRRESNPQSQQASGRRTTPLTSRPLGPAYLQLISCNLSADTTRKNVTAC